MSVAELKELFEHLVTLGAIQVELTQGDLRIAVGFGLDVTENFKVPATETDWS